MEAVLPFVGALCCAVAAVLWLQSAVDRHRLQGRLGENRAVDADVWQLARADARQAFMLSWLFLCAAGLLIGATIFDVSPMWAAIASLTAIPAVTTILGRGELEEAARLAERRTEVEQRAAAVLDQESLAPLQWANRLAPSELPDFKGFEIGQAYQPGEGALAGDFYDVFEVDRHRVAAVIGDVTGHGIEPSITALQAKYLLRAFLLQFRDPGQALQELNAQMSVLERGEEFVSLCVLVFDREADTLRYASAGHPAAFVWHDREVRPLGATGPLLMLDPTAPYHSRELDFVRDDLAVIYTDGLAEARSGDVMFGEDGVAAMIRREPTASPEVLTKMLVEAARAFAGGPLTDDLAVLVLRHA